MLFNSYSYIFGFLPVTFLGFLILGRAGRAPATLWLTAASIAFYAWWRPLNVLLIMPSIVFNYGAARLLERTSGSRPGMARAILMAGIVCNILFLGTFKYLSPVSHFLQDSTGFVAVIDSVVLPLGLSFITFQKIAFLVDVHAGRAGRFSLHEYALFVLFFPQLIAGPIVHYREMMPQFRAMPCRFNADDVAVALTLFFLGLAKKLVLADPIGRLIDPFYNQAAAGVPQTATEAWIAALGFTLQIYFDFSGYCDMALGSARLFGIKLPPNFNSPLKATSIIDFWQRWHISLTRFLTAYIYTPLTITLARRRTPRLGAAARSITVAFFLLLLVLPTMVTMFISGLWHGSGLTFVLWGLLHGLLLCINHAWRMLRPGPAWRRRVSLIAWPVTFLSVVFAMVLFRAPSVVAAGSLWADMVGVHGVALPQGLLTRLGDFGTWLVSLGIEPAWTSGSILTSAVIRIGVMLLIALGSPNLLELLAAHEPALGFKPRPNPARQDAALMWTPSGTWAFGVACAAAAGILLLGEVHAFIYWQF